MSSIATADHQHHHRSAVALAEDGARGAARYALPVSRALFAAIFLMAGFGHFSAPTIAYAASQGVPLASLAVPLSGVMCLVGGVSVLLGYRARLGALVLFAFLVPVTFAMHKFWAQPDAMSRQIQMVMFMKNVGLMGGALMLAYFGAGPLSLDARRERAGA
jgi:putative oxidoreductase